MIRSSPLLPLCLLLAGCEAPDRVAGPEVLATSVHFTLGDMHVEVPVVAVSQVSAPARGNNSAFSPDDEDFGAREARRLAERARDPRNPLPAAMLTLTADRYSLGTVPGRDRCAGFQRQWSRLLCEKGPTGLMKDLPDHLLLVDRRYLSQLESHFTVGGEKRADQVAAMGPLGPVARLACDSKSKFCSAALAVSPGVLAAWPVWSSGGSAETAEQMAARQAPAIAAWMESIGGRKPTPEGD